jgi:hypothetical protein
MKLRVTGSLGNFIKSLTKEFVQRRHSVAVIRRKLEKQKDIEALDVTAAIGSIKHTRQQDHELVQWENWDYE